MTVVATGTIIALLFFAREGFVPLSLAILSSFLLAIPCSFLERHGFSRTPAVLLVVALSFSLIGGIGWLVTAQFYDFAKKLPGYHEVIEAKLRSLKASPHGTVGQVNEMLRQTAQQLQVPDAKQSTQASSGRNPKVLATDSKPEPIPVEVHQPPKAPSRSSGEWRRLSSNPWQRPFMLLVVLVFMLQGREDLRNRLIRLAGTDRMDLTTNTLDEAADRLSRYLLLQLMVNCCFGLFVGAGLFFIGVPSPWLWGVLAMLLGGSSKQGGNRLSSREAEVLQLIAEGKSNKQVAAELGVSFKTVEKHREHLMSKLDIHDVAGLTRYAIAEGIIESNVRVTASKPVGWGRFEGI